MPTVVTTQQWDQLWLPLWPLASDDLFEGIYRTSRKDALGKRYIEANPQALSNLLVVDCDHTDALLRAVSSVGSHPIPNAVVENPHNGHAHAVWALETPVIRTEYAHRKPLAYVASVVEGLRRALDGDKGYSGLMTKNPCHDTWTAEWFTDQLYNLKEIEETLGDNMPPRNWRQQKRRHDNPIGLGRNCSLFDSARKWAYREVRNHFGDPEGLTTTIYNHVHERNQEFSEPLPYTEASCIARSISKWIITHSRIWADGPTVYEATFTTIQSARGKKSGQTRMSSAAQQLETFIL